MILFFAGMALFCGYAFWRLGERSLLVCGVLFAGLACAPLAPPGWFGAYACLVMALAVGSGLRRARPATPPTQSVHHAVCRPYHNSVASEGRE